MVDPWEISGSSEVNDSGTPPRGQEEGVVVVATFGHGTVFVGALIYLCLNHQYLVDT